MKIKKICIVFILLLGMLASGVAQAQTYEKMWKQVAQAEKKGLPQTVISLTSDIFKKAKAEQEVPQMLKAYTWRMNYRESLTPDSFFVDLQGLEQWATKADKPVERGVLHSLIAEMTANYARMNQWEIRRRTDIEADDAPTNIDEWSKNLFVQKIMEQTEDALKDASLLIETSAQTYIPFVELGKTSEYYHHDMYHLLASRGIETLENLRGLGSDSLLNARIEAIYQDMLNTYRKPGDVDALVLTTLNYLKWKKSSDVKFRFYRAPQGLIGLTQDPYLAGLNKLIADYGSHDICAEVYLAKAQAAMDDNAPAQGLQLCEQAIAKYSGYGRINALKNLKADILRPLLTVEIPQVVYPDDSLTLRVNHKNLKGFKVNLYKVNLAVMPRDGEEVTPAFLKKNARLLSSAHYDLQVPNNYQAANASFNMKAPGVGLYALQVVPDEKVKNNIARFLAVMRFKLLTREVPGDRDEVVVLDAKTGQPVEGVTVTVYNDKNVLRTTKTTGANGKVELTWNKNDIYLRAAKGSDTAMPVFYGYFNNYRYSDNQQAVKLITLLTDRGLYRPGQTVYVKGIMYNQYADSAQVVANEATVLTLTDANGQEVGRRDVRTNEFGSFTADFVLPTVTLNGDFRVSANDNNVFIRVEEYKRPTFDITFSPVKDSYRLGDVVQVQGKAMTYSGMPLQEIPAKYVVSRSVRSWGRWGMDETILSSDSVRLNNDGDFTIPVKLVPDASYQENDGMYFEYTVKVSVTNLAGETQTSVTTLAAGGRSLLLGIDLPNLINRDNPVKVNFQANNLNRQPIKVEGTYYLYKVVGDVSGEPIDKQKIAAEPTLTGTFVSNAETEIKSWQSVPSGTYKLVASAKDDQGREVQVDKRIVLFSTSDKCPPVYSPIWLYVVNSEFDAIHPAEFNVGTSEKDAYLMMDLFYGDKWLESKTLNLSDSIMNFTYPYKEEYGYGLVATFALVKNGQLYTQEVRMTKRLPDRKLTMKWDVFRDKLRPGEQEEWKLTIRTPQGKPADAEMLATMYDASLDKIWKRNQNFRLNYRLSLPSPGWGQSYTERNYFSYWFPGRGLEVPRLSYDHFVLYPAFGRPEIESGGPFIMNAYARTRGLAAKANKAVHEESSSAVPVLGAGNADMVFEQELVPADQVSGLRTNFAETAFFYPQLRTNEQGEVSFTFTMPQSLTTWNFRGYSHTKDMLIGQTDTTAVASKEFMLTSNLPRFVRVGDDTGVAATIANLTGKSLNGVVKMVLFDPMTEKVLSTQKQKFAVKAGETTRVNFQFTVTDKQELLGCRMVADGGTFSDGEQQFIPVLSNKEQITETLPLFISGDTTQVYSLTSLFNNRSKSATDRRLTVEFTGNPAWYAVQALPSLAQPQGDNAISWATAFYANTLASYIVTADPKIKAVFDSWKLQGGSKETFLSNLQKNQEVKNILLQESPWVLQATTEKEQKERIATLFDLNNIANNNRAVLLKLRQLQLGNGAWSWYRGMNGSRQITEYIVELNARLAWLTGKPLDRDAEAMQQAAFGYLHKEALTEYQMMKKASKEGQKTQGLSGYALKYMYLIAISHQEVPAANKAAYDYFLSKIGETLPSQTAVEKAYSVIVLQYAKRTSEANSFLASLKEYLIPAGEGLMIATANRSQRGLNTNIANQVAVMEALQFFSDNQSVIEKMKVWLLQQKQTQQWDSPVSTADAVFALLYRGTDLLTSQGDVRVTIGNHVIETLSPAKTTVPGLGYVKETFTDNKTVDARFITVEKRDAGIAWGAIYAQYEEAISEVAQQGGELNVERKLYVEKIVNNVRQLQLIIAGTPLSVGDKVVSRMTIRLTRGMDFVQVKEQRAACFEPVEPVSGYRWNDGAGYYVAVNDASSNFFFNSLDKGTYVLEYSYLVNRTGLYETGLTTIQSAYAPEYASHVASVLVKVD